MKKLQLLALSIVLSTPCLITYTSDQGETSGNKNNKIDSRENDKENHKELRENRLTQVTEQINAVKSKIDVLEIDDAAAQAAQSVLEETALSQLQQIDPEIDSLTNQSNMGSLTDDLKNQLQSLYNEKFSLLNILHDRKTNLINKIDDLRGNIDSTQKELSSNNEKLKKKQAQLIDARNLVNSVCGNKTSTSQEMNAVIATYNALASQVAYLEKSIDKNKSKINNKKNNIQVAQDALSNLQSILKSKFDSDK